VAEGADIYAVVNYPDGAWHGKTVYDLAMLSESYRCANLVLLHKYAKEEKSSVLLAIQHGRQALELLVDDPSFNSQVVQDKRILQLISNYSESIVDNDTIDWYQPATRRNSFSLRINTNTKKISCFKPQGPLGQGRYGKVRFFMAEDGEKIAVKTPHERPTESLKKELSNEDYFNALAYPEGKYGAFEFTINRKYTNRFIMPIIEANTMHVVFTQTTCPYHLANLILQIATELQRLHSLKILHRDVHAGNIMIYQPSNRVRFIDFGLSCLMDGKSKNSWINEECIGHPPELCLNTGYHYNIPLPKPHPRQDIYTFGYLLNVLIPNKAKDILLKEVPSIDKFIKQSLNIIPEKRPSLAMFCQELDYELNMKTYLANNVFI
jgi:serine/threonine protein kinase